ncbi:MAG: heme-binding protein [Myxococcota bacterium]|nr:heme-binding protein [Myxococcota bacterium]
MRPQIRKSVAAAGVTGAAALGWTLWATRPKTSPYTVVAKEEGFEVRTYRPSVVVCTDVTSSFDEAKASAQKRLLKYLNGENETGGKFSIIPPILEERIPRGSKTCWRLAFTLKEHLPFDKMPRPLDPRVELVPLGIHTYGAMPFSGPITEARLEEKKHQLLKAIGRSTWRVTGTDPMLAEYQGSPLPLLKRNEVLVAVGR